MQILGGRGPASLLILGSRFGIPKLRIEVSWATVKGCGPAGPVRRENVDCDWRGVPGRAAPGMAAPRHPAGDQPGAEAVAGGGA